MPRLPEGYTPIPLEVLPAWGGTVSAGIIRRHPEDFQVSEVPLVEPDGDGEHSWLHVQKTGSNTQWVAQQLAAYAGVKPNAVSYAGLKDRHAVTDQWFSVHLPGKPDPDWAALEHAEFQILVFKRHHRKLKTGALKGNRFTLKVRQVDGDKTSIDRRLEQVAAGGFPNYFGPQRFGRGGDNLALAAHMFANRKRKLPRSKRSIYLSAVRSALFNQVLSARVAEHSWNGLKPGEAVQLDGRSACFVAEQIDAELSRRLANGELHPTGPLCGDGESLCTGAAQAFEMAQVQAYQSWIDSLSSARLEVARRALRIIPGSLTWQHEDDQCLTLRFYLPAGCYATSLLAEVFELTGAV
ncbi:tRNA pseudouridine(13) synthase [hydrothermal vent metagenome]|uniref:tRNA pseudouridine(13) synthase n=1 Tax=hydrothermal vent metagenome TaxID=652676 RepID=A0A3B0YG84_9ZZZZ